MFTKDDVQAIGELFKSERQETRKIVREEIRLMVKEELSANNTVIGTIIGVEIASATQSIATAVKTGFHEIVKHINHLDELVEALEKQAGIPHPHKH